MNEIYLGCILVNPYDNYIENIDDSRQCNKRCEQLKLKGGKCYNLGASYQKNLCRCDILPSSEEIKKSKGKSNYNKYKVSE